MKFVVQIDESGPSIRVLTHIHHEFTFEYYFEIDCFINQSTDLKLIPCGEVELTAMVSFRYCVFSRWLIESYEYSLRANFHHRRLKKHFFYLNSILRCISSIHMTAMMKLAFHCLHLFSPHASNLMRLLSLMYIIRLPSNWPHQWSIFGHSFSSWWASCLAWFLRFLEGSRILSPCSDIHLKWLGFLFGFVFELLVMVWGFNSLEILERCRRFSQDCLRSFRFIASLGRTYWIPRFHKVFSRLWRHL